MAAFGMWLRTSFLLSYCCQIEIIVISYSHQNDEVMAVSDVKTTTIRFSEHVYRGLEQVSDLTGLPVNSIVVNACIDYLRDNYPDFWVGPMSQRQLQATLRKQAQDALRRSIAPTSDPSDEDPARD